MKVRIGISLGSAGVPGEFTAAVDELERAGIDSLWLPEMVYGPLVDPFAAARQRRPDADPASLVAASWPDARRMIEEYVAAGLTKFVIRPAAAETSFGVFLERFAAEMMPLQT